MNDIEKDNLLAAINYINKANILSDDILVMNGPSNNILCAIRTNIERALNILEEFFK